jgi:signal transduction histidine kinase
MTVIGGYLELARDSAKERRSKQYIVKAMAAAEEVARQLKLSADYQLIGSRAPEWLSLRMMAKTATRNIEPTQVSVTENLGDFEIFADPMMESVFRNLVENAIKHGVKTRTITFKAEPVDDGLAIHVMDDGIGIPEVLKEKLFEYVLQSRKGHGLHFVRELLGITGMTINEVGKEGSGADFVILVPQGRFRRFEPS